jgi:uncharacterized protein (TIGR03435 family)
MDPNATPRFQVTIESSKSDQPHTAFHLVQGNKARGINITLIDLISFAYYIHPNQAIGIPAWVGTDRFDIEVNSEGESAPSIMSHK